MAIFCFICSKCGKPQKRLLASAEHVKLPCKDEKCGGTLERDVRPPALHAKEVIDNGAMVRKVERFIDGEALAHERAQKDYRQR